MDDYKNQQIFKFEFWTFLLKTCFSTTEIIFNSFLAIGLII